jgi:hypothetical protein
MPKKLRPDSNLAELVHDEFTHRVSHLLVNAEVRQRNVCS